MEGQTSLEDMSTSKCTFFGITTIFFLIKIQFSIPLLDGSVVSDGWIYQSFAALKYYLHEVYSLNIATLSPASAAIGTPSLFDQ